MIFTAEHTVRFDAGHRYTATVEFERKGFPPDDDYSTYANARADIEALAAELRDRDLAKMLEPFHPSVWGIASFFMERLSLHHKITRIRVHESDGPTAIIAPSRYD